MIFHKQPHVQRSRNLFVFISAAVLLIGGLAFGAAAQPVEVNPALGHPHGESPSIFLEQMYPGGPDTVGFDFENSIEGWDFILPPDSILVESVCEDTCTFCWTQEEAIRPHYFIYPWVEEPGTLRWVPAFKGFYNSDCDQEWQVKAISAPVDESWSCLRRFEVRLVNRIDRPVYARLGFRLGNSDEFIWPGSSSDWVLMPPDEWMMLGYDDPTASMLDHVAEVAIMLGGWYAVGDVFIDKVEGVSFYNPEVDLKPPYVPPFIVGEQGRIRVRAEVPPLQVPQYSTGPLPDNATFSTVWDFYSDRYIGELLFTPTAEQIGDHEITFYASACQSVDSEKVVITVYDSLAPPVLDSIGPKWVDEMQRLEFYVYASDPNNDRLTMTADPLPDNATFSAYSGTQGRFVWVPEPDQVGEHVVTFYVTDGNSTDSETVVITVNDVNLPPFVFEDGHRTLYENDTLIYTVWSFDSDGTVPFLFAYLSDADTLATNMSFVDSRDGTGTLTFVPDDTQGGPYNAPNNFYVIFRAVDEKDPALFQNSATVTMAVLDPNLPPGFVQFTGPFTFGEGDTALMLVEASDPNGDSIVLSAPVLPSWSVFTDNGDGTGQIVSTPGFDQAGRHWIYLRASDGTDSTTTHYGFTVENTNRAPQLLTHPEDVVLLERDFYSVAIEATDPDGDPLAMTGQNLPEGAVLTDNGDGTGTFSFTSEYEHVGHDYQIVLVVADSNLSDQLEFTITVENLPLTVGQTGGEADVLIDASIVIPFNELVDETTVAANVTVTSVLGNSPSIVPMVQNETSVLVIQPTTGLFAQADTLAISIGTGVLDRAGFPLSSPYAAIFTTGAGVYPGDTDNNGVVDERDILPIGLYFETSGPARVEPGTLFELTPVHLNDGVSSWAPWRAVYADADGSGEVNADDVCAITDNWLLSTGATVSAPTELQDRLNVVISSLKGEIVGQIQESLVDCPDGPGKAALVEALGGSGSAGDNDALPDFYELAQNYPNPFNPSTIIEYALPIGGHVNLTVYNVMGQKVMVLVDRYETAGYRQVVMAVISEVAGLPAVYTCIVLRLSRPC